MEKRSLKLNYDWERNSALFLLNILHKQGFYSLKPDARQDTFVMSHGGMDVCEEKCVKTQCKNMKNSQDKMKSIYVILEISTALSKMFKNQMKTPEK